jgi:hypothetical protein
MEIVIGKDTYVIEKANIDFNKFDHEGTSKDYCKKSYVVIMDDRTEVKMLEHISDENNHSKFYPFDPDNYSKDSIMFLFDHGSGECYAEHLYKIISTTNKTGEVYYEHLDDSGPDWNSEWTFGLKNGIAIHEDLKNLK